MARAQAQYLRFFDDAGTTYQCWQSYYGGISVSFDSKSWVYVPFNADGFTAGSSGEETAINVLAPALPLVVDAFAVALSQGRFCELSNYQFDATANNDTPQAGQILTARFIGQVVGGAASITALTLQIGSALSPVGVQIPPRRLTTEIMGKGCKL